MWNGTLVSLLRSLSTLGVPPTAAVQRSIQTEVLWRVRRLSYKQLAFLADWGAGRNGQMEVLLVSAALKQLELRWTEIADARTVSTLMARAGHLSPALMDRLEDKVTSTYTTTPTLHILSYQKCIWTVTKNTFKLLLYSSILDLRQNVSY